MLKRTCERGLGSFCVECVNIGVTKMNMKTCNGSKLTFLCKIRKTKISEAALHSCFKKRCFEKFHISKETSMMESFL